jgi:ABC-type Fe3+-siderophore transport system permease subunit
MSACPASGRLNEYEKAGDPHGGSSPDPSQQSKDTQLISINAWRTVMILAILAAIAAAVLFTTGVTGNPDTAQSFRELGLATPLAPVV